MLDKVAYQPKETVVVTGSGFHPEEAVLLVVLVEGADHIMVGGIAGGAGTFRFRAPAGFLERLGLGIFTLKATGNKGSAASYPLEVVKAGVP
jgi:hypothetical protein